MKPEKMIKLQARQALRKNNWFTTIGCLAVTLVVLSLVLYIYYCFIFGFDLIDINTSNYKENSEIPIAMLTYGMLFLFVVLSPVLSGYTKVNYNIAKYGKSQTSDLFYYFRKPQLYFKAFCLNMLKFLMLFFSAMALFMPTAILIVFANTYDNNSLTFLILVASAIVLFLVALIIELVLYTKLIFTNYILAEADFLGVFFCINESFRLTKGHTISMMKLLLSYTLWYALCFFILPIFYVIPYVKVSVGVSAKWLMFQERRNSNKW